MVNVTIYSIHGSYGVLSGRLQDYKLILVSFEVMYHFIGTNIGMTSSFGMLGSFVTNLRSRYTGDR